MAHLNNTTKNTKGKHLTYEKRIKIEALSITGLKSEATALQIGCSGRPMRIGKRKDIICICKSKSHLNFVNILYCNLFKCPI